MSSSSASAAAAAANNQMILNRREYLYGASKKRQHEGIKALLREDHVFLNGEYSADQPDILWTSETANAYFKVSYELSFLVLIVSMTIHKPAVSSHQSLRCSFL